MKRISNIIQRLKRGATSKNSSQAGIQDESVINNVFTVATVFTTVASSATPVNTTSINNETDISNLIHLRLYSTNGKMVEVDVPRNLSVVELKKAAIIRLLHNDKPNVDVPTNVLDFSYLIFSKTGHKLIANITIQDLDVNDNDEFVLIQKMYKPNAEEDLKGPSLNEILEVTKSLEQINTPTKIANIPNLVANYDIQLDVRKVFISLAQSSAYVIGAGPYAERLIAMLKLRLLNRRKHEADTIQCLVDMGFSKERVIYALHLKNNVYLAALEWLIEHQSLASFNLTATPSSISDAMSPKNTTREKIEALLEIIRIYSYHSRPPTKEMIKTLVDMGFLETDVIEALKVTRNSNAAACEWLVGNRSRSLTELRDGLPPDSPILQSLLSSPQVQSSLGNPKVFLAYVSLVENYSSRNMWLNDADTSGVLNHIYRSYQSEKRVIALNQFNSKP